MSEITFIYFDLGGVVDIDFSGNNGWIELKQELGVRQEQYNNFDELFNQYEQEICTEMDIEEMKGILNEKLSLSIDSKYSLLQGFVTRFEQNQSIWQLLKEIKKKYRIGLFTMMYPNMYEAIKARGILPDIDWDVIIDSSKVGYTKYDKVMFDIATESSRTPKEEILLVENSKKHVDTANTYGWQTLLYNTKDLATSNHSLQTFLKL